MVENNSENLAELYYERLRTTTNPGATLANFMCELTGKEPSKSYVIQINKLIRIFDRYNVFFSIIDLSNVRDLKDNIYPLLYTICRGRFEKQHQSSTVVQFNKLDKELRDIGKDIEKAKKARFTPPSSEGL